MQTLKVDDKGAAVKRLQQRLMKKGFNPGKIDGHFGLGTEAAVMAFQKNAGLLADGVVGPRTLTALGLTKDDELPSVIPGVTVAVVSQMFPFTPIGNIKENLPNVLAKLADANLVDKPMVLMALGTIRAETESFKPIAEGISRFNTSPNGHDFDLYDNRKEDLGNRGRPDGERFRGRGYVQLTGRFNYTKFGPIVGLGTRLVNEPELACDSDVAARLLAAFLKNKERAIKEALLDDDLKGARRLVNGGSHGLDRFTHAYRIGEALLS